MQTQSLHFQSFKENSPKISISSQKNQVHIPELPFCNGDVSLYDEWAVMESVPTAQKKGKPRDLSKQYPDSHDFQLIIQCISTLKSG